MDVNRINVENFCLIKSISSNLLCLVSTLMYLGKFICVSHCLSVSSDIGLAEDDCIDTYSRVHDDIATV